MKITVLGSGGWGTALSLLLLDNGNDVTLWSFLEKEAEVLRTTRENPMLKGVVLPEALKITTSMDVLADSELVVMATPSFAVRETARKAAPLLRQDAVVVSVAKGIEKDTALCLTQIIEEELKGKGRVVALSGPSHAEEVGRRVPTGCVAASTDMAAAELVQDVFMSPRFRVYTNSDVLGVELGAALKNVLALCCGVSDGMGLGDNTKALLMTRGMTEMARLGVALGGRKETFAGLSGMGDLIVTCTSMHSRNRRCGILVGQGKSVEEAMKEVGATVEGYYAALSAHQLAEKAGVEMPICECAYRVLYEGQSVREVVGALMSRNKKREVDESWI
ncbi:MAG: NAD(P)-dependent glycerol-3-phosphate dehydrogenase [Oscillospiraceae bacterium]|jgi:glycerol-3-phosphate dehydrogenase (NAD(P)+)|nr:NAD(P)-dependent glycerol-3-phosphate dehydrogenase [Oscillospiraceae bacterium]MDE6932840.1 NAD(P)-dependent glycerol-3-phosphate dehydrogenase [Oscillospiraceae bacterium]